MKATIITAPHRVEYENAKIFLAGSIDMGKAEDWQARMIEELSDTEVAIYNPRRADFDKDLPQDITNPQFSEQVTWELDALDDSDVIAVYFDTKGPAPITLMELGLHAASGKLIVCCPEGYWRRGNVQIVCERYSVPMVDTLEELIELAKTTLALRGKATVPLDIDQTTLLSLALSAHADGLTLNQKVERILRAEIIRHENLDKE